MITLPWFKESLNLWQKAVSQKRLPHALLLSGINGLGKSTLALNMAHSAMCENLTDKGVCHQCSACHLFKSGNHPDLIHIKAEKNTIKVDQIRKLSQNITLTATRNQHKVIIIEKAELMNKSASNALLKTLEEPPANVVIILTTSEIGRLLATIKSRCVKNVLSTPSTEQMSQWIHQETNESKENISFSLLLASNSPLIALFIIENTISSKVISMLSDLIDLRKSSKNILEVSTDWSKSESYNYLNFIAAFLLKLIQAKAFNIKSNPVIENHANKFIINQDSTINILNFIHQIFIFMKRKETVLKTDLLLEELLINWGK